MSYVSTPSAPVVRCLGDTALSVTFGDHADPETIARVHAIDAAFNRLCLEGVVETVPTYRGITIHLDPLLADPSAIEAALRRLAPMQADAQTRNRLWDVPVVYGDELGADLDEVAAHAGLTRGEVIAAHTAPDYVVAMVGFLPGFSYLSGLNPSLAVPRRSAPRPVIPASSISIGGQQTAIGSLEGPSGWHLIGRTPARPFHPGRTPEFLFEPGDRIRLRPVSARDWTLLDRDAARGALVAECLAE